MEEIKEINEQSIIRFSDAPWYIKTENTVDICGLGSIGSWLSLLIARLGIFHTITLIDDDRVQEINLAGQLFKKNDIDKYKIISCKDTIESFRNNSHTNIVVNDTRILEGYDFSTDVVICCFDNMEARKNAFNSWKKGIEPIALTGTTRVLDLFIDGRLNAEQFEIFFIPRGDEERIKEYEEKYLFDDASIQDLPCSFKYTSHFAAGIAYNIVKGLNNHITNLKAGEEVRDVPFRYFEFGPLFTSEIK